MRKSISNSDKLNSPSQSVNKTKQLTLFELKNKSITTGNKENKIFHQRSTKDEDEDDVVMLDEKENVNKSSSENNLVEIVNRKEATKPSANIKNKKSSKNLLDKKRVKNLEMKKVDKEDEEEGEFDLDFRKQKIELKKEQEKIKLSSKTIGGENVFSEHPTLSNSIFGDLIMTIEFYNTHMILLKELMGEADFKEDVKLAKIDYDKLIECLKDDKNGEENFKYFILIIDTLLRLFINGDKNILKRNFSSIAQINNFNRQELCRIAIQINRKLCDSHDLNTENLHQIQNVKAISNALSIFMYHDERIKTIDNQILRDLYTLSLKDFKFYQKLDLLNGLCLSIMSSEVLLNALNELNENLREKNNEVTDLKDKLAAALGPAKDGKPKNPKEYENIEALLEKVKSEIKATKVFFSKCERKEPLGQDSEQNIYWKFDCLPNHVVRESRNQIGFDEFLKENKVKKEINKSTFWFKYKLDTPELSNLIRYLSMNEKSNEKIISKLKTLKVSPSIDDSPVENKNETNIENPVKIDQLLNIRRSERINKTSDKISNGLEEEDEEIVFVNKLDKETSIFEMFQELEPIDALYNMLNIFNKRISDYLQSEIRGDSYYENWMKIYDEGISESDSRRKFETLKTLLCKTTSELPKIFLLLKINLSDFYSSLQKTIKNSMTLSNFYVLFRIFDSGVKWWKADSCEICKKKRFLRILVSSKLGHKKSDNKWACADCTEAAKIDKKKTNKYYVELEVSDEEKSSQKKKETTIEKAGYTLRLNKQRKGEIEVEKTIDKWWLKVNSGEKLDRKSKKATKTTANYDDDDDDDEEEESDDEDEEGNNENKQERQKYPRNVRMKAGAVLQNFIDNDSDGEPTTSLNSESNSNYYLKKKSVKQSEKTKRIKRPLEEDDNEEVEELVVDKTERAKELRPRTSKKPSVPVKKAKTDLPVVDETKRTERAKSLRTRGAKKTNSDIEIDDER